MRPKQIVDLDVVGSNPITRPSLRILGVRMGVGRRLRDPWVVFTKNITAFRDDWLFSQIIA